jgi:hypothetical protein
MSRYLAERNPRCRAGLIIDDSDVHAPLIRPAPH